MARSHRVQLLFEIPQQSCRQRTRRLADLRTAATKMTDRRLQASWMDTDLPGTDDPVISCLSTLLSEASVMRSIVVAKL